MELRIMLIVVSTIAARAAAQTGSYGSWPRGCDEVGYYLDLLDNPKIPDCQQQHLQVDTSAQCAAQCAQQPATFCEQGTGPLHPYTRFYCACGDIDLVPLDDPRREQLGGGSNAANFTCAFNECDTECLNFQGFVMSIAIGVGVCLMLLVFGECAACFGGTKEPMCKQPCAPGGGCDPLLCCTPYSLYYVVLFLEIFNWLSDLFFILYDLCDPRMEAGAAGVSVAEHRAILYTSGVMLLLSTLFSLIPFLVADFRIHFTRVSDDPPNCPCPYSCLCRNVRLSESSTPLGKTKMKPLVMLRFALMAMIVLDIPQLAIQIAVSVITSSVSLIAGYSFALTGLLWVVGPYSLWWSVPEADRSCIRLLRSKQSAVRALEKRGRSVPPEWSKNTSVSSANAEDTNGERGSLAIAVSGSAAALPAAAERASDDSRSQPRLSIWGCESCTFRFNSGIAPVCEICGALRGDQPPGGTEDERVASVVIAPSSRSSALAAKAPPPAYILPPGQLDESSVAPAP